MSDNNQLISTIHERINGRAKSLEELSKLTKEEINQLSSQMQKDHQQLVLLETKITQSETNNIKQLLNDIEKQQQKIEQFHQATYKKIYSQASPPAPVLRNVIAAFIVGGVICVIGQLITNFYLGLGLDLKEAGAATAATLVFIGAFLTGLGIYDEIGRFAGAGSIVPITGFANSMVSSAMEFKREGYVYGVGAKLFTVAGPVIVYGTVVSIIIGLFAYIF